MILVRVLRVGLSINSGMRMVVVFEVLKGIGFFVINGRE